MNSLNPELRPDRLQDPDVYDHRVLGTRLDLFHQQEEGPGMVFWHPRGWALYRVIEDYIRRRMREAGFAEIRTPQPLDRKSVVEGKSVPVRVDLGGRGIINKNKKNKSDK